MSLKVPLQNETRIRRLGWTVQYFSTSLLVIIVAVSVVHLELARVALIGSTKRELSRLDMVLAGQTSRAVETVDFILRNTMEAVSAA